jgi:hypothetical protein
VTTNWPGWVTETTPPQLHIHLDVLFKAGVFLIRTFGDPGTQGLLVIGMQGAGVGVPSAAAVAAATAGFDWVMHMPKGMILAMGMLSFIVAAGCLEAMTIFVGKTTNELGVMPNEHCSIAPMVTSCAILNLLLAKVNDRAFHVHRATSLDIDCSGL